MDVISEVIGTIRAGRPSALRVRQSGTWGMYLPGIEGMGFHVVLKGTGWLITPSGQPVPLHAGDVVLVPHGVEHGLSHTAACTIDGLPDLELPSAHPVTEPAAFDVVLGCYRLERGRIHRFLRELPPVITMSPDYDRHPETRVLIEMLVADVAEDLPGAAVSRSALVDLTLVHALRQARGHTRLGAWPEVTDPGIAAALNEMHTGAQRPWTLGQLATIAGMSLTAFKRRFTLLVGTPPMTYLTDWRLTHSARVLRETKAPLAAIARQVGYSSEYAFANAFRRKFGIAPGRFRDRMTHEPTRPGRAPVPDAEQA
ncbi:AraC-like DNA-binding protein [Streptomyces aurantiacus]|uniref:AraC family transcriptional regulator n=1 Tax=Streptomyces aurantiacus TaxID=47760 RepID=UPI00278E411B|nr:AraC family transcriptional regulator [Streptomyces aurantiacus]MDQ0773786.1 AraC-like DNA-binding protein [Streptomyces aurantiacus]